MPSDCVSGVCTGGMCAAASCSDGVQNGGESDVDCGGTSACARCPDGSMCTMASDCATGMCTSGVCGNTCGTQFLRINELHGGDGPGFDFVEIINTGTCTVNLTGIAISTSHNCSSTRRVDFTFSSGTLAAGAVARIVDVSSGLLPNEYYAGPICWDAGAEGWTALCMGACNTGTCSNFIDYQEQNDVAGRPTGAPTCATFTPAPFSVASITSAFSDQAVRRATFVGSGTAGVASDWAIGTYSR